MIDFKFNEHVLLLYIDGFLHRCINGFDDPGELVKELLYSYGFQSLVNFKHGFIVYVNTGEHYSLNDKDRYYMQVAGFSQGVFNSYDDCIVHYNKNHSKFNGISNVYFIINLKDGQIWTNSSIKD